MRRIALLSAVAGIALIAACSKAKDDATPPPPPPPPPAPAHQVTILLKCDNDGASIDVHPWRVKVTQADGVIWFAPQEGVWITPKVAGRWPFAKDTIVVPPKEHLTSTNFKSEVDSGTYSYNISGVCTTASGADTVVLDPDMIIPTRIQTR
ncbi:MAG TPA: hypothetical protein VJL35_06260 [Gemmatimonadaceae bacterium]|jgi:hypothetical protein|nr:hypothetical protein [Gemmatimonadaceae bacterium]